jgi:hypothetical protein
LSPQPGKSWFVRRRRPGAWLKHSRADASLERDVSGVLLTGLGLAAALAGNQRK